MPETPTGEFPNTYLGKPVHEKSLASI